MKHCRLCGKEIDNTESECARCDKLQFEAFMDTRARAELEI